MPASPEWKVMGIKREKGFGQEPKKRYKRSVLYGRGKKNQSGDDVDARGLGERNSDLGLGIWFVCLDYSLRAVKRTVKIPSK